MSLSSLRISGRTQGTISGIISTGTVLLDSGGSIASGPGWGNSYLSRSYGNYSLKGQLHTSQATIDDDLHVGGKVYIDKISVSDTIADLTAKLQHVQEQLRIACERIEECYYSPDGPGAAYHQTHFESLQKQQ